jgi:hypothetical protein
MASYGFNFMTTTMNIHDMMHDIRKIYYFHGKSLKPAADNRFLLQRRKNCSSAGAWVPCDWRW